MKKLLVAVLGLVSLSCGGESMVAPSGSRLEAFVSWQGRGVADRKLEIVELSLERITNSDGLATFSLPAGTYTLRAYVNGPGPALPADQTVTTRVGETTRVNVGDCLPCVSPS